MSYFSVALEAAFRQADVTQREIAEKAKKVTQSQISRYLSADSRPEPEELESLALAFGKQGAEIVRGYLRDLVPRHLARQVSVSASAEGEIQLKEEEPTLAEVIERLPLRTRKAIETAARLCEQRPEVLKAFEALLVALR